MARCEFILCTVGIALKLGPKYSERRDAFTYCYIFAYLFTFPTQYKQRRDGTTGRNMITAIYQKLSGRSQEGPARVLGSLGSPLVKNICQFTFIISTRNLFHHFESSPSSFLTLWQPNDMKLEQDHLILPQQSTLTITIIFQLLFYNECESRDATPTKRDTFQNRFEK